MFCDVLNYQIQPETNNPPTTVKKLNLLLLTLPLLTLNCFGYFEGCPNWYISATPGLSWHSDTDFGTTCAEHEIGISAHASIGYIIERWRLELEGTFLRHSNDKVTIGGAATDNSGHSKEKALLFNIFYNIPLDIQSCYPLTVYLGSGAGIGRSEVAVEGSCSADNVFAWQFITGITCDITEHWALTFGYRFFSTAKPKYSNQSVSAIPYSNNIDLGLRLTF